MLKLDKKTEVIIDTNILIYMYNNKKDVFDFAKSLLPSANFYVLDRSFDEIDKVLKDKPRKRKLVQNYLEKLKDLKKYEILKVSDYLKEKYTTVDRLLIYFSKKYIIYTNDKKLRNKIKAKKRRVLTLRLHGVYLN